MGIFSKIFGGDKLELVDDSQDITNDQEQEQEDEKESNDNQNKTASPFLMDDEDDKS